MPERSSSRRGREPEHRGADGSVLFAENARFSLREVHAGTLTESCATSYLFMPDGVAHANSQGLGRNDVAPDVGVKVLASIFG